MTCVSRLVGRQAFMLSLVYFLSAPATVEAALRYFHKVSDVVKKVEYFGDCPDSSRCNGINSEEAKPRIRADVVNMLRAGRSKASSACHCEVLGDACNCDESCDAEVKDEICLELLGACSCTRSLAATCECFGHCPDYDRLENACWDEPGCEWTGVWCEAQMGLMWD
eukprot:TRINITY_DN113860_c0_g1_i1.p1 TRINITY_DN113860_c0_g1~~TRINITY_DN113860_c0_g1_i1.p1  ORF type:complete len:194 (+),score=17.76 TRINITY_DN113860_c0_g1_i1:84-584(+)